MIAQGFFSKFDWQLIAVNRLRKKPSQSLMHRDAKAKTGHRWRMLKTCLIRRCETGKPGVVFPVAGPAKSSAVCFAAVAVSSATSLILTIFLFTSSIVDLCSSAAPAIGKFMDLILLTTAVIVARTTPQA